MESHAEFEMTEIATTIIWITFGLYLTVCPFICLYWLRGGFFYRGSQRLWRANHKVLTYVIGIGGFIATFVIISIGMFLMFSFLEFSFEHPLWVKCWRGLFIIPVIATFVLYDAGCEYIQWKGNNDREWSIKNELDHLRWDYCRDWDWAEEEHKQIIAAEIREQIDKLNKNIGSATKKGLQIRRREELEALYMFLDEVQDKQG